MLPRASARNLAGGGAAATSVPDSLGDPATVGRTLAVLHLLMRFVVRSWRAGEEAAGREASPAPVAVMAPSFVAGAGTGTVGGGGEPLVFQEAVLEVLYLLDSLMSMGGLSWLPPVRAQLQRTIFPAFGALRRVFFPGDLGDILRGFLESIPPAGARENCCKLVLVHTVVTDKLFRKQGARDKLMPVLIRTLQTHMASTSADERTLAIAILKATVSTVQDAANADDIWSLSILLPELTTLTANLLKKPVMPSAPGPGQQPAALVGARTVVIQNVPPEIRAAVRERADSAVCFLAVLFMLPEDQYEHFFSAAVAAHEDQAKFITNVLEVLYLLILRTTTSVTDSGGDGGQEATAGSGEGGSKAGAIFQQTWLVMVMFQMQVVLKVLRWFAGPLTSSFNQTAGWGAWAGPGTTLPGEAKAGDAASKTAITTPAPPAPNVQVWTRFLVTALAFFASPILMPERLSPSRAEYIQRHYSDLRVPTSELLQHVWGVLGGVLNGRRRLAFVEALVGPLLRLTASAEGLALDLGHLMYYDMVHGEFLTTGGFSLVERVTIDTVDQIVNERRQRQAAVVVAGGVAPGGESKGEASEGTERDFMAEFTDYLEARIRADESLRGSSAALRYVSNIKQLFERLSALAALPKTDQYEDERTREMLGLLNYLSATRRDDMFIKYIFNLKDASLGMGLHAEAAYTLLVMAEHDWASEPVIAYPKAGYPSESAEDRRYRAYKAAVDLMDEAQLWESALPLLRQLRDRAEQRFDYPGAAALLRRQADMCDKIAQQERFFSAYFRVTYFGRGFPQQYQNVTYVYRGNALESIMDFSGRITRKFPGAQVIAPGKEKPEYAEETDLRLQISKVTPAFEEELEGHAHSFPEDMPPFSTAFETNNGRRIFYYSRPFRKRKEKSANEFLDCWVNNTFLVVEKAFPTTHRRQIVVERRDVIHNPLETAVVTIRDKNVELKNKIDAMDTLTTRTTDQSFTMMMNGVVDAAVAGGVKNYETFLNGEYRTANPDIAADLEEFPEKAEKVAELQTALEAQLVILKRGMSVHGRVCSEGMMPLHEFLMGRFEELLALMRELGLAVPEFSR